MKLDPHPLQSIEWAKFREKEGVKTSETDNGLRFTIHRIPYTPWTIGYAPKGSAPTEKTIKELERIAKEKKSIFIQLEPNTIASEEIKKKMAKLGLVRAAHPLFTKYDFILDLTKREEDLLKAMHPKTRYNIKVAQKHGVEIVEDNSDSSFDEYLRLTKETTTRQKFYAHSEKYHRLMWETLRIKDSPSASSESRAESREKSKIQNSNDKLTAHLLSAKYKGETLATWILFVYKNTLYYPYGASSSQHRETMASNLMMWEAIRFGKRLGLKNFDMWGALESNPNKNDPWFGFHRFKEGYGPQHVEFIGSYDLVCKPFFYQLYKIIDKIRWIILRLNR